MYNWALTNLLSSCSIIFSLITYLRFEMLDQIESPCLGLGHIAHDYDTKHETNECDQDQVDEKEGLGHSLRRHEAPGGASGLVTNSDIL